MREFLFAVAFLFGGVFAASAQDIITVKDGTDIQAKILEVTTNEVKYKKFNNLDGPTFTMLKSEILIVRYENGENEVFKTNKSTQNTTETVYADMKYREYKDFYNAKSYIPQSGDPYSRGWAGVASALIPGLGEGVDGEWGRGAIILLGNIGLFGVQLAGVSYDSYYSTYEFSGLFWIAFAARLGLNIWSICDAVHIAKVKNMYYQDIRSQRASLDFKIEPFFAYAPTGASTNTSKPAAGLSMTLTF